jgi:hypothetical protein
MLPALDSLPPANFLVEVLDLGVAEPAKGPQRKFRKAEATDALPVQMEQAKIKMSAHPSDLAILSLAQADEELRVMLGSVVDVHIASLSNRAEHGDARGELLETFVLGGEFLAQPKPIQFL